MSYEIEQHAAVLGAAFEVSQPVFDLAQASKEILDALASHSPTLLGNVESIRQRIPLPMGAEAAVNGRFYRLPNHNRSFCYALSSDRPLAESPVLVFKGSEPLLSDFRTMLNWMSQAPLRKSSRVMTDHFPLAEGKIPGALSMKEALREAEIALDIQKKHLAHYGELARLPTPVLVHSISETRRMVCEQALRGVLSPAAFDRIEPLLRSGLAIYIYHYPASPVRSNYWGDAGTSQFKQFVAASTDESQMIGRWVTLLVRLLYLGFLPYSIRNEGLGACMDFGNATLDGGFCDPDSIIAIDEGMEDEFVLESMIQSLNILQHTVQSTLGLSEATTLYPSIENFACCRYVQHLVSSGVVSEVRPGLRIDDRIVRLMSPRTSADVKGCASRRHRTPVFAQFVRRSREVVRPSIFK